MSRVIPRTLKGFRDYLPDVMIRREAMLSKVVRVFESFGFPPLGTPALEYSDILLGKYGTEGEKLLYRFEDNGARDVCMRYDLTVPLARVVGQYRELPRPFRRYQIAPVWRAENTGRGRFREFVQCDVDIVGSSDLLADFECIQVAVAVLRALDVSDFEVHVNDRRVLDGLLRALGAAEPAVRPEVLRTVDKLPKIGWDAVAGELREKVSFSDSQLAVLQAFLQGSLADLNGSVVDLDVAGPGIESLHKIEEWAAALGIGGHVAVDLSIARGLDYYTGTVFETFLGALPGFGSVMSGGRYDGLLEMFSGQPTPAVGISLGVDRLLAGLTELGLDASPPAADVFVTVYDAGTAFFAQEVAAQLRASGLRAQLHLSPGQGLGKQMKAAARSGASFVLIAGPEEVGAGRVGIKRMDTGEQRLVPAGEAAKAILGWRSV